jgi:hypothetical protein
VNIEVLDLLTVFLLGCWIWSRENEAGSVGIGEIDGFAKHVGLFGAGEGYGWVGGGGGGGGVGRQNGSWCGWGRRGFYVGRF